MVVRKFEENGLPVLLWSKRDICLLQVFAEFDSHECLLGVLCEVALLNPSEIGGVATEHVGYSASAVFPEVDGLNALFVEHDASGEVHVAVSSGVFGEEGDVVLQRVGVSVELRFEHFERGACVGFGGVCFGEVFFAVEFVGGGEVALFHLVENGLNVYESCGGDVEIDAGAYEFFYEKGNVEVVGVVTGEVAVFKVGGNAWCFVFEGGAVCHVGVADAVDLCGFFRNVHTGVEALCGGVFGAVGHAFDVAEFHNAVCGYVESGCFYVEEDDGAFEMEFHSCGMGYA